MRFGPLTALAILLLAAHSAWGGPPPSIPFATLARGDRSEIRVYTEAVARSAAEWRALWGRHTGGSPQAAALPRVDLAQEMVLAVFAGDVPARTRVVILKIDREVNCLVVLMQIANLEPGPAEAEPSLATPFHIVRTQRSALPVVFRRAKVPDIYASGP